MSAHSSESDSSDSSDEESELQLRDILMKHSLESAFEKTRHEFVPEGVIETFITYEEIKSWLGIGSSALQDEDLMRFIFEDAKRMFAITVVAKPDARREAIEWLRSEGYNDQKLPIFPPPKKKKWTSGWRRDFCNCQWMFVAPVFDTTRSSHTFEEARILPFISMSVIAGEGAFGQVSRTVIHERHMGPVSMILERSAWLMLTCLT